MGSCSSPSTISSPNLKPSFFPPQPTNSSGHYETFRSDSGHYETTLVIVTLVTMNAAWRLRENGAIQSATCCTMCKKSWWGRLGTKGWRMMAVLENFGVIVGCMRIFSSFKSSYILLQKVAIEFCVVYRVFFYQWGPTTCRKFIHPRFVHIVRGSLLVVQ